MRSRRGFTLVETVLALVVTGLVAALAYAALRAGLDVDRRLTEANTDSAAQAVFRDLLSNALRHASDAPSDSARAFEITAAGGGGDGLRFVTTGLGVAPGAAGVWDVRLRTDRGGAVLEGVPRDGGPVVRARLDGVRTIRARALARASGGVWTDRWESQLLPAAVRLDFDSGAAIPGLLVHLGPGDGP